MVEELALAEDAVAACVSVAAWALTEHDLITALHAAHRLEQRLAAVKLMLVREVDGRGTATAHGTSSTAVWLRDRLRLGVGAARRLVELAATLDSAPPGVRDALTGGTVDVEQVRVIADTITTVHATAGPEAADKAVGVLVDWAAEFDASLLRKLGTRILDHIAPEVADAAADAALRAAESRAARDRHVTINEQPDGRLRLTGVLDTEAAAALRAAIDPLTAPSGPDDTRTPGQRRHDALADVCRLALRTGDLPEHGGDVAQVVVTTSYDELTRQLGSGALDTGLQLTSDTVRRLACDATILPAILGGAGQPLDVGRQRRLITGPLRRALVLRDRGCAFPGCDRPPRWCDAHHIRHWADGGPTSLANAVLLCGHHHRHLHHSDWTVRLSGDGHPEFIPPTWLDPTQLPRRNHYHRRT
ncbi:HNH endonuclease signature motif containing protein [Micromonospora hortensis]|uniref:HNH endonuclease signature motif containing protein n=1 Tax=Micromonospora hortensis TaxID=2911209 RepID=UPI001EE83A99|nr:HNH endonuclease signature motif containing protein [Micromonospora hortensis]MCG5453079.1 HNH endonuclease [Micromonospora hortensis]